jgi:hypothetical protein
MDAFNSSLIQFMKVLETVSACGCGDGPEDYVAVIEKTLSLVWRPQPNATLFGLLMLQLMAAAIADA